MSIGKSKIENNIFKICPLAPPLGSGPGGGHSPSLGSSHDGGHCDAGSAGHGGKADKFRKENGIKYGWSYGNNITQMHKHLIGGSSGEQGGS